MMDWKLEEVRSGTSEHSQILWRAWQFNPSRSVKSITACRHSQQPSGSLAPRGAEIREYRRGRLLVQGSGALGDEQRAWEWEGGEGKFTGGEEDCLLVCGRVSSRGKELRPDYVVRFDAQQRWIEALPESPLFSKASRMMEGVMVDCVFCRYLTVDSSLRGRHLFVIGPFDELRRASASLGENDGDGSGFLPVFTRRYPAPHDGALYLDRWFISLIHLRNEAPPAARPLGQHPQFNTIRLPIPPDDRLLADSVSASSAAGHSSATHASSPSVPAMHSHSAPSNVVMNPRSPSAGGGFHITLNLPRPSATQIPDRPQQQTQLHPQKQQQQPQPHLHQQLQQHQHCHSVSPHPSQQYVSELSHPFPCPQCPVFYVPQAPCPNCTEDPPFVHQPRPLSEPPRRDDIVRAPSPSPAPSDLRFPTHAQQLHAHRGLRGRSLSPSQPLRTNHPPRYDQGAPESYSTPQQPPHYLPSPQHPFVGLPPTYPGPFRPLATEGFPPMYCANPFYRLSPPPQQIPQLPPTLPRSPPSPEHARTPQVQFSSHSSADGTTPLKSGRMLRLEEVPEGTHEFACVAWRLIQFYPGCVVHSVTACHSVDYAEQREFRRGTQENLLGWVYSWDPHSSLRSCPPGVMSLHSRPFEAMYNQEIQRASEDEECVLVCHHRDGFHSPEYLVRLDTGIEMCCLERALSERWVEALPGSFHFRKAAREVERAWGSADVVNCVFFRHIPVDCGVRGRHLLIFGHFDHMKRIAANLSEEEVNAEASYRMPLPHDGALFLDGVTASLLHLKKGQSIQ